MFNRGHSLDKVLSGEQPDLDIMAVRVTMWHLEPRFGYMIVQENMKVWEFISSNLKAERDVDTLNRSKPPEAAWRP